MTRTQSSFGGWSSSAARCARQARGIGGWETRATRAVWGVGDGGVVSRETTRRVVRGAVRDGGWCRRHVLAGRPSPLGVGRRGGGIVTRRSRRRGVPRRAARGGERHSVGRRRRSAQRWAASANGTALGGGGGSDQRRKRSGPSLTWSGSLKANAERSAAPWWPVSCDGKKRTSRGGRRHGKGVRGGPADARSRIRRARTVHHIAVETADAEQIGAHRGGEEDPPFVNRRVCWHGAGRRNDNRGRSDWGGRGLEKNRWSSTIPRHPFVWSA